MSHTAYNEGFVARKERPSSSKSRGASAHKKTKSINNDYKEVVQKPVKVSNHSHAKSMQQLEKLLSMPMKSSNIISTAS